MPYFEPEYIEPDDLIKVDGNYYAVFNLQGDGYDFPLMVYVDNLDYLVSGATPSWEGTTEEWENANNRIFVDAMDYSQLKGEEELGGEWTTIEESLERSLEREAEKTGDWIYEEELVQARAIASLEGRILTDEEWKQTDYFQNTTSAEINWMTLTTKSPEKAQELMDKNKASINRSLQFGGLKGSGRDKLASRINKAITQEGMGRDEANMIIKYISDPYFLAASGGKDLIPEEYHEYLDTVESTKAGELQAKDLIVEHLGQNSLQSFIDSGMVAKYSGMLRMDGMSESSTMKDTIVSELQSAHDTLFPHFSGSKHNTWSPAFYNYASQTLGNALSTSQKHNVDNMARDFKGDFTQIGKVLRRDYKDTSFLKNQQLNAMGSKFKQDLSAVY